MMVVEAKRQTVEEFEAFALAPEQANTLYEFVGGEIVRVVSNPYSSKIASRINTYLGMYLLNNDIGHLTGADGGYRIGSERYIPDVAFISYARQPELSYTDGYNPNPPDLAVEVLSPANSDDEMTIKVANYLAAGTVVWMVKPTDEQVAVFKPGQPVQIVYSDGTLDGDQFLPGFSLAVKDIFPPK